MTQGAGQVGRHRRLDGFRVRRIERSRCFVKRGRMVAAVDCLHREMCQQKRDVEAWVSVVSDLEVGEPSPSRILFGGSEHIFRGEVAMHHARAIRSQFVREFLEVRTPPGLPFRRVLVVGT